MATIIRPETRQGKSVLTDALLERCAGRAPGYDRANTFLTQDFNELKDAGYLTLPVPEELGGGLLGFGNIYYGMAKRALDITVDTVKRKNSIGLSRPMAYHAEVQHAVAKMAIELARPTPC
ncbi:MAG: hypothetical protein ACR2HZ_04580 [Gemmatimonadaceae bacterium]